MNADASDLYKVLQVDPQAEKDVIEAAYRRLAGRYHPDKNSEPQAHEMMLKLNDAYAVLSDAAKRREYDRSRSPHWKRPAAKSEQSLAASSYADPIILPHVNRVYTAEFMHDGTRLVTLAHGDSFATIWTVPAGAAMFRLQDRPSRLARIFAGSQPRDTSIDLLAVSPTGPFIVTTNRGTTSAIAWDARTGRGEHLRHDSAATGISFSHDGELVAVTTADRKIHVWMIASVTKIAEMQRERSNDGGAVIDPARRFCAAQDGSDIKVWIMESGRERMRLTATFGGSMDPRVVRCNLRYTADGRLIGVGHGSLVVWDVPTGSSNVVELLGGCSGDSSLDVEGTVDVHPGQRVSSYQQHGSPRYGQVDESIVGTDFDHRATSMVVLRTVGEEEARRGAVHSYRSGVVSAPAPRRFVETWDIIGRRKLASLRNDDAWSVRMTRDGRLVIVSTASGNITILDKSSGEVLSTLRQVSGVSTASISPDSRWLASASSDVWLTPVVV